MDVFDFCSPDTPSAKSFALSEAKGDVAATVTTSADGMTTVVVLGGTGAGGVSGGIDEFAL